jgi:hypothetical protein
MDTQNIGYMINFGITDPRTPTLAFARKRRGNRGD